MSNNSTSIKDIVGVICSYYKEVVRYKYFVVLCILPFLLYFLYKAYNSRPTYTSNLDFLVESESGATSAISGLLGNIGIGRSNTRNALQLIEIGYSTPILSKIMFSKSNCKDDYLINAIIDEYSLNERWTNEKLDFIDFKFVNTKRENFNNLEKIAFQRIIGLVRNNDGDNLLKLRYNKETALYSVTSTSYLECLSDDVTTKIYEEIKNFYTNQIRENKFQKKLLFKNKRDSIKQVIDKLSYRIADIDDSSFGVISEKQKLSRLKYMVERDGYTQAYRELSTSYEIADLSLREAESMYVLVDKTLLPIEPKSVSLINNGFMGLILGAFFSIFVIVIRKVLRDSLD